MVIHEGMVTLWNFGYGLGYATIKFFDLESMVHMFHTLSYRVGGERGGKIKIATSKHPRYLDTLRPFSPNPMTPMMRTPKPLCPKEAMKWMAMSLGFKIEY
jgi:hypothetical protein